MEPTGILRASMIATIALGLLTSACASPGTPAPHAETPRQPSSTGTAAAEEGLRLSGSETPQALKLIAAAPYAMADPPDCDAMARGIADLDKLLGPDVDRSSAKDEGSDAGRMAMGAVRGAIPYRWVVRWMTGASRKDRDLQKAILAGAARRGYLKGVRRGMACPSPGP